MIENFRLSQWKPGTSESYLARHHSFLPSFVFKTCLRELVLEFDFWGGLSVSQSQAVWKGKSAYEYLLEVICGCHSPIFGETEVHGQFKSFAERVFALAKEGDDQASQLSAVLRKLLQDAKWIRENFLQELGSRSYGSWLREELRLLNRETSFLDHFSHQVHADVLGGGNLAQAILPWLEGQGHRVFVRDPIKVNQQFEEIGLGLENWLQSIEKLEVFQDEISKSQERKNSVLILAAPVSFSHSQWKSMTASYRAIYDLRAAVERESFCATSKNYRSLEMIFDGLKNNSIALAERKDKVIEAIRGIARERFFQPQIRPMGWDDICA